MSLVVSYHISRCVVVSRFGCVVGSLPCVMSWVFLCGPGKIWPCSFAQCLLLDSLKPFA